MTTWTPISVDCGIPEPVEQMVCQPWVADCLFDLTNDPCETNNIAASHSAIMHVLKEKITAYNTTAAPPIRKAYDPASNPEFWEGWWVPWLDPNPVIHREHCPPFNPAASF